jgi:heat shock protein HspQ
MNLSLLFMLEAPLLGERGEHHQPFWHVCVCENEKREENQLFMIDTELSLSLATTANSQPSLFMEI